MPQEVDTRRIIATLLDLAGVKPSEADLHRLEQIFALGPANPRQPAPETEPALVHPMEEWPRDA
ncbi:MAG: hypothetical protein Kow0010_12140 [Dehalococcoidia bacterium]